MQRNIPAVRGAYHGDTKREPLRDGRSGPGACLALVFEPTAVGDDFIITQPIAKLKLVEGSLPPGPAGRPASDTTPLVGGMGQFMRMPYVVLDQPGEAYLDQAFPADKAAQERWRNRSYSLLTYIYPDDILTVRIPSGQRPEKVTGRLVVPAAKGMTMVKFVVPLERTTADAARAFAEAKDRHYDTLVWLGGLGSPWFRHQRRDAIVRLTREPGDASHRAFRSRPDRNAGGRTTLDQTYGAFQRREGRQREPSIDRPLLPARGIRTGAAGQPKPSPMVKLDTLEGISVAAINWDQKLAGRTPAVDPLARAIPADQHAMFLPGLAAAQALLAELRGTAIPALELGDYAGEVVPVQRRYERQLGVSVADLAEFQAKTRGAGVDPVHCRHRLRPLLRHRHRSGPPLRGRKPCSPGPVPAPAP